MRVKKFIDRPNFFRISVEGQLFLFFGFFSSVLRIFILKLKYIVRVY